MEKLKLSPFMANMIMQVENPKEFMRNQEELINGFHKFRTCKINLQDIGFFFLCTDGKQFKNKIE